MKEFYENMSKQILSASGKLRIRPLEKESAFEFKARKKEMFLVKYTLQAKLDEISCYKAKETEEEKKVTLTFE